MKLINKFLKGREGFTLIELIVVIAVLGILSGIAIPRLTGVQEKAHYAAGEALLANIRTPLELYRVENGGDYPEANDYDGLQSALTGEDGYLDNLASILPKSSSEGWNFSSYSYDPDNDDTYTLVIEHSKVSDNLTMTTSGISRPSD